MPTPGGNQLPRMELAYIREFTKKLIRRPRSVPARTFSTQKVYADTQTGGGSTTVEDQIQLTIPNNGTVVHSIPLVSFSAVKMWGSWTRGSAEGYCEFGGYHDGTTAVFRVVKFRGVPGFDWASFAAAVNGSDIDMTFAADNAGSDIELSILITLAI